MKIFQIDIKFKNQDFIQHYLSWLNVEFFSRFKT